MKQVPLVILLALALPACDDDKNAPAAPSAPVSTTPAAPPRVPPAPPLSLNEAPVLEIKIRPDPPGGPLPREVTVNMCGSRDPEGDRMIFEFKWGGTGGTDFSFFCRSSHTYERPGRYRAFFCVNDNHDHRACSNVLVDITP